MAFTLEQLQAQRDTLTQAINQGVRRVTIDGMVIEYGTADDMIKARTYLDADIARLTPAAPAGYTLAQFSKDGRGNNARG
jgi:hypothetical protein